MTTRKTDNKYLETKLHLRRFALDRWNADEPLRVLDCCQGEGVIWRTLRKEYPVNEYVGIDVKDKPGRLKMDSTRLLASGGWGFNVIDVDTYGMPWKHWNALLPHVRCPVLVFLTCGRFGVGSDCKELWRPIFGSEAFARDIPRMIRHKVMAELATATALHQAGKFATIRETFGYTTPHGTEYVSCWLEPIKKSEANARTSASDTTHAGRSMSHV